MARVDPVYISISAGDRRYMGKIRIFLDGKEVTHKAYWARVPAVPGIEAHGEVGEFVQPLTQSADGDPMTQCRSGVVYWIWKVEADGNR